MNNNKAVEPVENGKKKKVGYDFPCDFDYNLNLGGYKINVSDTEFIIYGNSKVDLLNISNGAVALRALDSSIFEMYPEMKNTHLFKNVKFEKGVVYTLVSVGNYNWIFKDVEYAIELFNMIFTANYRGVQNKVKKIS